MIRYWNKLGLTGKTTLMVVIPVLVVILASGFYFTQSELNRSQKNSFQRGSLLVKHYASIIELGMVAQDTLVLTSYASILLREKNVVSVIMFDNTGTVLVEKNTNRRLLGETPYYFSALVSLSGVNVGNFESDTESIENNPQEVIGQLRVGMLLKDVVVQQSEIVVIGLIGTLASIMISLLVGYGISRRITTPILKLNNVVELLTLGNLSSRIVGRSDSELGELECGINEMAMSLQKAHENLQTRVDIATSELKLSIDKLEKQNIEQIKLHQQAEKIGEEKMQFLARMSHELRTPLNAVIGFSQLIGTNISPSKRQEYIETITQSASQLSTIVDDVLTLSKLKSGNLLTEHQQYSPQQVCEDTVAMLSNNLKDKNVELVLIVADEVPDNVDGDASKIQQILTNLIGNAIKFTNEGEIVVHVKTRKKSTVNTLIFSVTDTGCGINLEKQVQLFDEFIQVGNLQTRMSDGVGLGLSISRRLARKMKGDISVNSEENIGTCFELKIPFTKPTQQHTKKQNNIKLLNRTALLYGKHYASRFALDQSLAKFGMKVFNTKTKNEIIHYLSVDKQNIDVLVLSFTNEQVSSADCHNMLKQIIHVFNKPIIVFSGANAVEMVDENLKQNHIIYLSRSYRQQNLYQNLTKLLKIEDEDLNGEVAINPWLEGDRVLVVEDNKFNQKLIKHILQQRGAVVDIADNGTDALVAVEKNKYCLILMDLHMPDFDGVTVSKKIKKNLSYINIPIVLITADVFFNAQELIKENIINQVLHKPINEKQFDYVIRNILLKNDIGTDVDASEQINSAVVEQGEHNQVTLSPVADKLKVSLQQEILRLCDEIQSNILQDEMKSAREHCHQLIGLSGYYQLEQINQAVNHLQMLVKQNSKQAAIKELQTIKEKSRLQA